MITKKYKLSYTASEIDEKLGEIDSFAKKSEIPTIPTSLKNPNALTIDGVSYDGSTVGDFTNVINDMIDAKTDVKADVSHTHDDRYYTESEIDAKLAEKSDTTHNHDSAYDIKGAATDALASAKSYTDSVSATVASTVKNDLLNGAGVAYDTLKELGDLIDENHDAISALETVASGKADAVHTHTKSQITDFPTSLKNPNALTINGTTYDGSTAVSVNIDNAIDEESVNSLIDAKMRSVKVYGAKGDGVTDDTTAFQSALAAERVVSVPSGTYVLSDTLIIRQNCRLNFSQDTVLKFTQTSGNCIEMLSSATLQGNHGVISVPYAFTGNVVSSVTTGDETRDTPPYTHWCPQWKRARYIYDVCIIKPDTNGLCYMRTGDTCTGNGIYLSCDGDSTVRFMWGVMLQGVRIAGAFTNGIKVINYDLEGEEDSAWNHDMRIEAVIEGCETGVSLTNCNGSHLAVTIQPQRAQDEVTPYAKWGVYLNDCKFVDMASSVVWDWNDTNTLYGTNEEYTAVAMYGNCAGLVLYDYAYYRTSVDTRNRIYTDTASNLERMTILQEPITRWFKPVDGVPYFSDGLNEKKLITEGELATYFDTDVVKSFTDVLATATDADGNAFNDIGYKLGYRFTSLATGTDLTASSYYMTTGFIPVEPGSMVYCKDLKFNDTTKTYAGIVYYNSSKARFSNMGIANVVNGNVNYVTGYAETEDGCSFQIASSATLSNNDLAYVRFVFPTSGVGTNPMIAIDEEIAYKNEGYLADGINVNGNNVILTSPSGKSFRLTVNDDGTLGASGITI